MRRGELLGLHWSDVNLDEGWLEVTQTLEQTNKHGLRLKEPKSEAGRRKISLPQITVRRRWGRGTISTNLDVIWGMSD